MALIWAVFDKNTREYVPGAMATRVRDAYTDEVRGRLSENNNPILKVPLVLFEVKGVLNIEEAGDGQASRAAQAGENEGRRHSNQQLLAGLYAQSTSCKEHRMG